MIAKQAVIYCRVSTQKQAFKGGSLSFQLEDCLKYCKENNIEPVAAFSEIGSGDARCTKNLPARAQAVSVARASNAVIVVTLGDRFSREMPHDCPYWDLMVGGRVLEVWKLSPPNTYPGAAK
jgi:DNA invertase Pin-like site-specific DNA recombinase